MINRRRNFIFIHINKTAGRSISTALSTIDNHGVRTTKNYHFHMPMFWLMENIPDCKQLFSFAFVRNPFDWLYSNYAYITRELDIFKYFNPQANKIPSFKEWLLEDKWYSTRRRANQLNAVNPFPPMQLRQFGWWLDVNGTCAVDYIGRYEQLHQDFDYISQKLGMSTATLPHVNENKRNHNYRTMYDTEMIQMVEETHADDLSRFGYTF